MIRTKANEALSGWMARAVADVNLEPWRRGADHWVGSPAEKHTERMALREMFNDDARMLTGL